MERADRLGFSVATAAHVLLFGVLSLGLVTKPKPLQSTNDPMEVALVDDIGLKSAMPTPAIEEPAPSEAPEIAPPAQEAAPAPAAEALPTPAPPRRSSDVPQIAPQPREAQPKKQPAPLPDTGDRRRPDRPQQAAKSRLSPDLVKGLRDPAPAKEKAGGSRLGPDFLKGISASNAKGKAQTPRAATVDARAMAGLAAAIAAQVRPCYVVPAGGADASSIVTVLRLRFKPDGSTATQPTIVEQTGVNAANGAYSQQMGEAAKRAVLRCAPLKLPAELYEGGWEDIEFVFNPRAMGG